jgi:pimeloyl-ACP methyl ester carboxylesterase
MTQTPPQQAGPDGGLAPAAARRMLGIVPNAAHQAPRGLFQFETHELAVVEFDDQGRCYDRAQIEVVAARIESWMAQEKDAIIVVFVHGWKHDARTDDSNLLAFQAVLEKTVKLEADQSARIGAAARPVLGVFVGWRGMSLFDRFGVSDNLTFWDRQEAGRRVSTGSVRELLGRFRHYHNHRKDRDGAPLFIVVGHSFGGMIVYSALAQSLIEAASVPANEVTPRFADLVLLVNPAIEGARYLPIYDLTQVRSLAGRTSAQPPVFICATASNDWATGWAFPIGNASCLLTESWLDWQERQAMINTIGHLPWLRTHDLSGDASPRGYALTPPPEATQHPFWVVRATPDVINGHNGIFGDRFLKFVADRVFEHVEYSRSKTPMNEMIRPA